MTDGDALLAAIRAHPDEDTPRLLYADWLQENGYEHRAEFIRVQIELARGPDGIDCESLHGRGGQYDCLPLAASLPPVGKTVTARCGGSRWTVLTGRVYAWFEASNGRRGFSLTHVTGDTWKPELVRRERDLWAVIPSEQFLAGLIPNMCWRHRDEPLRERQCGWVVRRGFVDEAKLTAADWLAHADAILAAHPVRKVRPITIPDILFGPIEESEAPDRYFDGVEIDCKWTATTEGCSRRFGLSTLVTKEDVFTGAAAVIREQLRRRVERARTPLGYLESRWPDVAFEPSIPNPFRDLYTPISAPIVASPELQEAMAVAGLEEQPEVTPQHFHEITEQILRDASASLALPAHLIVPPPPTG